MPRFRSSVLVVLILLATLSVAAPSVRAEGVPPVCATNLSTSADLFQPEPIPLEGWAFEGCWTFWPAGPCRDIYRDGSGGYWRCGNCGATQNPSPTTCSQISIQTLNIGYWCS